VAVPPPKPPIARPEKALTIGRRPT
jgi:hypothetical protein